MRIRICASMAATLALCAPTHVAAQRTHIVDLSGSGTHRTIQAAVDAATSGDRILVRKGRHAGFTLRNKAIRILGDAPYSIRPVVVTTPVTIEGVPAAQDLVLSRLRIEASLTVKNSPGRIVANLLDLATTTRAAKLAITNCAFFLFSDIDTGIESTITDSTGTFVACEIPLRSVALTSTQPGLVLVRSKVVVAGSDVYGGLKASSVAPAISMQASDLKIHDEGSHPLHGNARVKISGSGSVVVDDQLYLGLNLKPKDAISGPSIEVRDLAVIGAGAGRIGQGMVVLLAKKQANGWALLVGQMGPRIRIPGIGGSLELSTIDGVLSGPGGSSLESFTIFVPNDAALIGATLAWQGLTIDAQARLEWTNLAKNVVMH